jgi:hypothetical protein
VSEVRKPSYEELEAELAELRVRDRLAEAHLERINHEPRPVNRTLLALLLQMSRSLTGGARPTTVDCTVYFVENGYLVTNFRDFGALSDPSACASLSPT